MSFSSFFFYVGSMLRIVEIQEIPTYKVEKDKLDEASGSEQKSKEDPRPIS